MCIFCTVSNRHLQRRPDFILAFLPIVSYNGMENKETADHSGMTVLRILTVPVLPSDKGCRQVPGLYTERGRGNLYRSEKSPWPGAVRLPVCWSLETDDVVARLSQLDYCFHCVQLLRSVDVVLYPGPRGI